MGTKAIIIYLIWLPQSIHQFMAWLHWIQVKEYRMDRFRSFLLSWEGKKKTDLYFIILKIVSLSALILTGASLNFLIVLLMILDLYSISRLLRRAVRRPVITERIRKMIFIGLLSLILVFFGLVIFEIPTALLLGEILLVIAPIAGVILTIPVVNKIKKQEFFDAQEKLLKISPTVIGITGSYGKTTTKDFLADILKTKYKVEKTKKNENTIFGVARKILNEMSNDTEVFVAELGAYRRGEIKELSKMIKPSLGVITGIEPQHLDLFGNMENIKTAKFELIESLPENGTAVFNLSNEDSRQLYTKAKQELTGLNIYGYVLHKNIGKRYGSIVPDIESRIIESNLDGVVFETVYQGYSKRLSAPVTGIHFIENITSAILIARLLDVSWEKIELAVNKLKLPDRTMSVSRLSYGSLLIDDSYNSTPKGFLSALNYLSHFKNKSRVVVTPGIIELGDRSPGVHRKIGSALTDKSDFVIVTNSEPAKYIKQGFKKDKKRIMAVENHDKLLKVIEKFVMSGSVILLEGKMPAKVYKYIKNREQ